MQYIFFRCLDCGAEFEQTEDGKCPHCGSDYIEEGYLCEWCGVRWAASDYCRECVLELTNLLHTYGKRHARSYGETLAFVEDFINRHW